jgi:Xaa-Pro aminopeptidase
MVKDGDLILCDIGAKKYNICSDITTTFPVNGKFTKLQKDIYDVVLDSQLEIIKNIKPGVFYQEITKKGDLKLLEGLKALGILKGEMEDLEKSRVLSIFMPHSYSHYLGFITHDVGPPLSPFLLERIGKDLQNEDDQPVINYPNCKDYQKNCDFEGKINMKELKKTYYSVSYTNLQTGNVITVEPGIYFIDVLIEKAKACETKSKQIDFELVAEYRVIFFIL